MAKTSKAKRNATIAWILGIILVAGVVFMFSGQGLNIPGTGDGKGTEDGTGTDLTGTDCNTAPSLVESKFDDQQRGTAVTADANYLLNGEYVGTSVSSFKAGDKVTVLYNSSSYIDTISEEITMVCGANNLRTYIKDYSAPTLSVLEDLTALTDNAAGGASNASGIAVGGSDTYTVRITGVDKDTSGQLVYVVELSVNTNVSSVVMYDPSGSKLQTTDVPSFYSNTLSSPYRAAFIIPEVTDAIEKDYKLTVAAKSGKDIQGAVYTTAYVGQAFVEDDGSFTTFGVEQIDGDTKYEATFDYDFYIN